MYAIPTMVFTNHTQAEQTKPFICFARISLDQLELPLPKWTEATAGTIPAGGNLRNSVLHVQRGADHVKAHVL